MTVFLIIAAVVLLFAALLCLPIRLVVSYNGTFSLTLRVAGIPIRLLPQKKKKRGSVRALNAQEHKRAKKDARAAKKAQKKNKGKKAKEEKPAASPAQKPKKKKNIPATIRWIARLIRLTLGRFWGYLDTEVQCFAVTVATGDPATTAVAYGAALGAGNTLLELLRTAKRFRVREENLSIVPDFLADEPSFSVRILFTLRPWQILSVAWTAGSAYLRRPAK